MVIFKGALSVGLIWGFVWVLGTYIPRITDEEVVSDVASEETQTVSDELLEKENELLSFENQEVVIKTNYGDVKAILQSQAAPKHVESFVRLSYRDYYDGLVFHRMVEGDDFSVIQGGDPDGTGTGGASAFGTPLLDELWLVKPETGEVDGSQSIINNPVFADQDLYKDFDKSTGTVKYRKGLLIMAKTAAPDSAGSQFFITLADTILPAQYTVFGVVLDDSFGTLDKILDEVDPIDDSEGETKDGTPNQEIRIEDVEIKNL
ncbi:hypothetical protein HC766_01290 [Candidatus Gracilibacteria bacterium]|nr:hypothetical protein [Thermales bacterium]NJS41008.1 hypothetical protein [Candidatus Gracilibacteria bacterium]